ncbi:MAG: PilX N-terminal domain-containing pilus assembly protein [Gammaproteobacteria bacterium]|nr:PilX N-terminal domain-containing pilus assembly protein [Gammaproteobacteria bacterium]
MALSAGASQRGTALIMSMVILMILTILGITAMGTASLEEKMSGNTQEATRAFQAAESGLSEAFNGAQFELTGVTTNNYTYDGGKSGSATVNTEWRQNTNPRRSAKASSAVNFESANFNQQSTGTTPVGAKAVVNQGVAQLVPKSN